MKLVLSHPTGNANVRAVAKGFVENNILQYFHTAIAAFPGNNLDRISNIPGLSEIKRRMYDISIQPYTKQYPYKEIGRLLASKCGCRSLLKHETGIYSIDSVYQNFDRYVAKSLKQSKRKGATAVYAYEDGAVYSFQKAKEIDLQCFYDLPIGYWRAARRLLKEEQQNRPDWAMTLTGFSDSQTKLDRKDTEISLADHIFVASSFTAKTLQDYTNALPPISIIPYGFPPIKQGKDYTYDGKRPLKILFVGGLSQRKGIANLFEAVEGLEKQVELTIIGRKAVENCDALNNALEKHTWIQSLPHDAILTQMYNSDVLIFPSLFEGFGLVITEAMSQGTPVITTGRTVGPDIIETGKNGWIVEAGNTIALRNKIEDICNNPKQIELNGKVAIETASNRPWSVYGSELSKAIISLQKE